MPEEQKPEPQFSPSMPLTAEGKPDWDKLHKEGRTRTQEPAKTAEPEKPETPRLPRSTVRELNKLRDQAAEERGRRLALEETLARGAKAADELQELRSAPDDPEPQRKDFPAGQEGDAKYNREAGRWDARQEAKKLLTTKEADDERQAGLRAQLSAADEKFKEDVGKIADWDAVREAAAADDEQSNFVPSEHPIVFGGLAGSDVRAYILHYWAQNPKELQKLLDMTATESMTKIQRAEAERAQARAFNRLEGRVENLYTSKQAEKPKEKKAEETAVERDARLPKPSEAVAPKGGTATDGKVSRFLADGVTVNPAHLAKVEERMFHRR